MPVQSAHRTKYITALIILLFAALPFVAFPEIIFGGQTLYLSDLSWIHYPRHIFAAQEWLAGRVPLWDPYQFNGLPLLAETQVGALYPPGVLFLSTLSPSLELSLYILLHFTLAATFTFVLARLLGLDLAPAAVASLAFGFGGFLMAQVPNLNIVTGAVWLPLALAGLIWAGRRRSVPAAMLAGMPLALQIFTAQPQIVFYTLLTLLGYAVYRISADWLTRPEPRRQKAGYTLRTALLMAGAVSTGLLLSAPQWLATLELQRLSVRAEDLGLAFLTQNSLPPALFLNLVLPGAFGNNVVGFGAGDPFQEDFIYIGFVPLLLVFFSLPQFRRRDALFFFGLLLAGVLLALGRYTPLYATVVQHLPGFSLFRIPSRWLMVVNLSLAMLAGFGLQTVLERGISTRQMAALASAGLLILLAAGLAWIYQEPLSVWANAHWHSLHRKLLAAFFEHGYTVNPLYHRRLLTGRAPWLTAPVYLTAANIAASLLLFGLLWRRTVSKSAFGVLVVGLAAFDLAVAGGTTLNPTQPDAWWQQLSGGGRYVLEHLEDGRVFPLGMGSERAAVSHLGQYFPSAYRVRSAGGHGSSLALARTEEFLGEAHPVQIIQVMGVRYLLTEGQMSADVAATYPVAFADDGSFVYENHHPLPRAFLVYRAIAAASPEEALSHFTGNELDPAQTVVLEGAAPLPAITPPPVPGRTNITTENPQHIEIETDSGADGFLVLLDTHYPGWEAAVDGAATEIYRANVVGRAVFVPAGRHTVTFDYRPQPFRLGAAVAGATLLALAAAAAISRRKHQPKN